MKDLTYTLVMIGLVVLIVAATIGLAPSTESIAKTVEAAGYTNVSVSGPDLFTARFRCSESDTYYYTVNSATNANGQQVTNMFVCAGLFKGHTIRYR